MHEVRKRKSSFKEATSGERRTEPEPFSLSEALEKGNTGHTAKGVWVANSEPGEKLEVQ